MKPKDLKFPFTWEERQPALHDGVLIIPQYFDRHEEYVEQFSYPVPLCIEYCSGNGDWIIEKALDHPESQWVAVEKDFERVRKIWSKMKNRGVENLLIVCGEAYTFMKFYLPDGIAEKVFVNFPDPWPKEKHAKHRLVQSPFAKEVARIMRPGGICAFATDDPPYTSQMIAVMNSEAQWKSVFDSPHYTHDIEDYGVSWFSALWTGLGRKIHYMQFERI